MPSAAEVKAIEIRPVAGCIGAEVTGVDVAAPLTETVRQQIWEALLAHRVLFFHDQTLTHAQQVTFGARFGELTRRSRPQRGDGLDEHPEILTISPQTDLDLHGFDVEGHLRTRWATPSTGWHTDMTHAVDPPTASVLLAEMVPSFGGDTQWTNLVAAYQGLSEPLRDLVDGLTAEHTFWAGYRMDPADDRDRKVMEMIARDERVSVHPVVRVHPETGERALFVNPSRTSRIMEVSPAESRHLLELLFAEVARPEYTVRLRWRPGTIAFWDNRSTAHIAATDADASGEPRILHRVTLAGTAAVGPTGFASRALLGSPLARS